MKNLNELQKEVLKTFEILAEPGQFTEVRILNTKQGTLSGYYNDVDKLIEHIQRYDGQYNIYITMNALSEGIEASGKNYLKSYAKNTTSGKEICCRRWILIERAWKKSRFANRETMNFTKTARFPGRNF